MRTKNNHQEGKTKSKHDQEYVQQIFDC
jgi:hypothetical protein